jgi:hypothetical protein
MMKMTPILMLTQLVSSDGDIRQDWTGWSNPKRKKKTLRRDMQSESFSLSLSLSLSLS